MNDYSDLREELVVDGEKKSESRKLQRRQSLSRSIPTAKKHSLTPTSGVCEATKDVLVRMEYA